MVGSPHPIIPKITPQPINSFFHMSKPYAGPGAGVRDCLHVEQQPAALSDPARLYVTWLAARALPPETPESALRRASEEELVRTGLRDRMRAATALAASPAFSEALGARAAERAALRDEDDLSRLCGAILEGMGADMEDLQVRVRRKTRRELRRQGYIGRRAQFDLRITPTIAAARDVVAGAEDQLSEAAGAPGGSSETEASGAAGGQFGQGTATG